MGTKRIIVNRAVVDENVTTDAPAPVFTVIDGDQLTHGNSVVILGPSVILYNPKGSPAAGRRIWIETQAQVIIQGQMTKDAEGQYRAALEKPCEPCP